MRYLFATACIIFAFSGSDAVAAEPAWRAVGAIEQGDPRVEAELVLDARAARPGDEVVVGVELRIDPEWHVYWKNSGESGLSTEFEVESGLTDVGELMWPAPHLFVDGSGEIATFGYADRVLFWREARVPDDASGSVEVTATIDYLACKVDCIPGRHELTRTVTVGAAEPADFPEELKKETPRTPTDVGLETEIAFSRTSLRPGEEVTATVVLRCAEPDCPGAEVVRQEAPRYTLIPDVTPGLSWRTVGHETIEGATKLTLRGEATTDDFEESCALAGVVWMATSPPTPVALRSEIPCSNEERVDSEEPGLVAERGSPSDATSREEPSVPEKPGLLTVLLFALLGGMILNLMPCVFPVLAVKVFSFVKLAHENRSDIYRHSGAYTAGIVASMMVLAGIVIGLKAAGNEVGWGFQFQEPLFIAFLAAALVLFALNLFGLFEIVVGTGGLEQVREAEHGLKRSFGEGVLAVVLATPCSAPFLGTAIGFAFSADALTIVAVFFTLGLGLALPFAVLTAIPSWAKLLPKPGPWMETFKQLLGFALLGTVVWLVWVLGQGMGSDAVTGLLTFLLAVGLAAWAFGKVQWKSGARKWGVVLFAAALVATTGWFALDFEEPAPRPDQRRPSGEGPASWPDFDETRVRSDVDEGAVVFVDFTADWCITCKVNERGVLSSGSTEALFREHGVRAYVADWTRKDDRIRAILARHGKAGVPMYLVYRPGAPDDPEVLPELLTEQVLRSAIERAAAADD